MRKIALSSLAASFCLLSAGQHTEISAGLNTGLLSFRGKSVESSSFVIVSNLSGNYLNDIYSNKPGFGIGADISIMRVGKKGFIYGLSSGIELLKHNVPITAVNEGPDTYPATGTIDVHTQFITLKPFVGHRFYTRKKSMFDIGVSFEAAIDVGPLDERGVATIEGSGDRVYISGGLDDIPTDFRAGLLTRFAIARYSIMAGYYLGLRNYYQGYTGSMEAYSKILRISFGFQLNRVRETRIPGTPKL